MFRTITVLAAASLLGCGSGRDDVATAKRPSESTTAAVPRGPRPSPGIDLDGPIPLPDPNDPTTRRLAPKVIDMMSDRAIVKVSVPAPPHGGAARFTFADNRNGWATLIPDAQQLPSVAYAREKIYISGGFESYSFYALNAHSGEIEWATTQLEDNGPTAAVIDRNNVLFNTESCTLFALDAATGKRKWYRYLGDPTLSQIAVIDGLVYASHPAAGGQRLSAYKVSNGEQVWSREVGSELLVTPVIAGDSIYVSTLGGQTYRFDHRTGKQRWSKPLKATTAPWVAGSELYVSRRKGGKEQQIVVSTETGEVLREHHVSAGSYTNDVPTHLGDWKMVWAFEGSRPVVDRGIRYVAMGNEVHASDAATGEAIWRRRYPTSADQRSLGSVALAGSALVVSSRDGKIFGLDVDTGYTLWSYDIGKKVAAEPIIAQGWLYATTTDGYVVALEVSDPSLDGWHNFGGNAQKNGPTTTSTPTVQGEGPGAKSASTSTSDSVLDRAQQVLDVRAEKAAKAAETAKLEAAREQAEYDALYPKPATPKPFKLDETCVTSSLCLEGLRKKK